MRAHFGLPSVVSEDKMTRPPLHVRFEIPYFTVSGIQVNQLFSYCVIGVDVPTFFEGVYI